MATNPFKAFIPYLYVAIPNFKRPCDAWEYDDPSGGQWSTVGLTEPIDGEGLVVSLQGAGTLMAVQFNERILPGKVRDEMLAKEVARIEQAQGRKVSKKDYAQLRDQCEFTLLPKAFIRRTKVMVLFTGTYMLICTSSQRRADDVAALLISVFGETFQPSQIAAKNDMRGVLTTLAKEGSHDLDGDVSFCADDSAVLKGAEKRTVRIKDKDISDSDVQTFIQQAYEVTELGVSMLDDGEEKMTLVIDTNLCFKRIENVGVKMGKGEDFFQFAVLCTKAYRHMLTHWMEVCGGAVEPVASSTAAADEDDEL